MMTEKELKKNITSLYKNNYIDEFAYNTIVRQIDVFLNSLPNVEASRVSENEQPKEVCTFGGNCYLRGDVSECNYTDYCSHKVV